MTTPEHPWLRSDPEKEIAHRVKLAQAEVHRLWLMVNAYSGAPLCLRCGSGYPICTDGFPHQETCGRYRWSRDVCADCEEQMAAAEFEPVGGGS